MHDMLGFIKFILLIRVVKVLNVSGKVSEEKLPKFRSVKVKGTI